MRPSDGWEYNKWKKEKGFRHQKAFGLRKINKLTIYKTGKIQSLIGVCFIIRFLLISQTKRTKKRKRNDEFNSKIRDG